MGFWHCSCDYRAWGSGTIDEAALLCSSIGTREHRERALHPFSPLNLKPYIPLNPINPTLPYSASGISSSCAIRSFACQEAARPENVLSQASSFVWLEYGHGRSLCNKVAADYVALSGTWSGSFHQMAHSS